MREALRDGLRFRGASVVLLTLVCASAFIGRSVNTSDGAEVISEGLGVLIRGEAAYGRMPSGEAATAGVSPAHSMYGLFPTLLALPVLAPAWLLRARLGARGLDAAAALLWTAGVMLCGWAFGRLVRALEPSTSGLWAPAFVAGTFLWPYAADSFIEPFAAAALAAGAAVLIRDGTPAGVKAAALWSCACLLKPILWLTVPLFVLAAALGSRRQAAPVLRIVACFGGAVALQLVANALRGNAWDVGYGSFALRFSTPLSTGLAGLLVSPGKGLVFYAPVVLLAAFGWRRLASPARLLLFAVPAAHVLVVARWSWWEGGAAWGPRLLLPVLPLICAPAVHAPRRAAAAALAVGAAVNVLGVLLAPGSWIGYAELLRPPAAGHEAPAGSGLDDPRAEPHLGPRVARRAEPRRDRAAQGVARGRRRRRGSASSGGPVRVALAPPARDEASAPVPDDPPPPRPFRGGVPRARRSREGPALGARSDAPLSRRPGRRPASRVRRGAGSRRGEPLTGVAGSA